MTGSPPENAPRPAVRAVVLAGSRGAGDPLCRSEGVETKALIDIAGQPMLAHVLRALAAAGAAMPVTLIGLPPGLAGAATAGVPTAARLSGGAGPASALLAALGGGLAPPFLVTTCDHPLLTPEMIAAFLDRSRATGADLTVGLAPRALIEAEHPATRRTWLCLGGAEFSGCNLFFAATPRAAAALGFWQDAEKDRKRPWRIALRLGIVPALRLLLSRGSPEGAFAILSRRIGATVAPVVLPFADAAIDVDSPADLALVRAIFARRTA